MMDVIKDFLFGSALKNFKEGFFNGTETAARNAEYLASLGHVSDMTGDEALKIYAMILRQANNEVSTERGIQNAPNSVTTH